MSANKVKWRRAKGERNCLTNQVDAAEYDSWEEEGITGVEGWEMV